MAPRGRTHFQSLDDEVCDLDKSHTRASLKRDNVDGNEHPLLYMRVPITANGRRAGQRFQLCEGRVLSGH